MPSAVLFFLRSRPACSIRTTSKPEVKFSQSSRTKVKISQFPTNLEDINRTVLRRSELNSRTLLIGEQPNPSDLVQPEDRTSQHRGAKIRHR